MARIVWKRTNVLISFGILLVIASALYLIPKYIFCDHGTSLSQLNELCRLYSDGDISGNLCPALCTDRSLVFHECLHVVHGKVVLRMLWNDTLSIIMKSEHSNLHEFVGFDYHKISSDKPLQVPSPSLLRGLIFDLARSRFGKDFNISSHLKIWNVLESDDGFESRDARTQWLLMQQDEYLMMSVLNGHTGVPELYGNCGHYYVTEFLPPGKHLSSGNFLSKVFPSDWQSRANLAIQLMDIVKAFDSDYHEMLHFCDMKGLNFGVSGRQVKAIDLDMAVFETYLLSEYNQVSRCVADADCNFFDCRAWCVSPQQRCLPIRINSNLQTLCDKVFLGGIRQHAYVGLLDSPPSSMEYELSEALYQCANPPTSEFRKRLTDSCQSTLERSSQESRPTSGNSSSADQMKCREALEELRNLLVEESSAIYKRFKKIQLRTDYV